MGILLGGQSSHQSGSCTKSISVPLLRSADNMREDAETSETLPECHSRPPARMLVLVSDSLQAVKTPDSLPECKALMGMMRCPINLPPSSITAILREASSGTKIYSSLGQQSEEWTGPSP